ncbi:stage II sporulation protein M, partial [Thermococci archaeon]
MRRSRIFEALLGVFLIGVALGIVFTVLNPQFAERMFENLR